MVECSLCNDCRVGYFPPFERFEQVAVIPNGPAFLKRCKKCGSLWDVELRTVSRISREDALKEFPGAGV